MNHGSFQTLLHSDLFIIMTFGLIENIIKRPATTALLAQDMASGAVLIFSVHGVAF